MTSEHATEELPTQNPHANTNAVTDEYPAQNPDRAQARRPTEGSREAAKGAQGQQPRARHAKQHTHAANSQAVTEEYPAKHPHGAPERQTQQSRAESEPPSAQQQGRVAERQSTRPPRGPLETSTPNPAAVTDPQPAPRKGRLSREVTGALAAGIAILAFVVLVLQIISWSNGVPGLGVVELIGHLVAAGLALWAQRIADRRPGRPALLAKLGIGVLAILVLVLFWWT